MSLKAYMGVVRIGFKDALAYRFHFVVNALTTPISLIIYFFLWNVIFEYTGAEVIRGFTLQGMISYYAINMIIGFIVWTYIDEEMEDRVINGTLTPMLLRPLNYFWSIFYAHIGMDLLSIMIELIPLTLISVILFGLSLPTLANGILFIISIAIAVMINFIIAYIVGLSAFWLGKIHGIRRMRNVTVSFFAGSFIPITFFPNWFQSVSNYLPFQYIRYVPITIYLGNHPLFESIKLVLLGLAWAVALYFIAEMAWKKAYTKFVGSGT